MSGHGSHSMGQFLGIRPAGRQPGHRPVVTCAARQADTGSWPLGLALAAADGGVPFVFLAGAA